VDFDVAGRSFRVEQGRWSDFVPVNFVLNGQFSEHGLAMFHVVRCDDEEVRVFVPPIGIDPTDPPPQVPISAPRDFALELQHEIGHPYDTPGWACITNPLKDIEDARLPDQSFIDDLVAIEGRREEMLMASLERPASWDVYLQVFSTTDRVAHMFFREFDPQHPAHDAALADTVVHGFGREFPLKDAIRQVYMNADRIVGRVLDKLASGALGPDPLLLVVSDHGFSSFRKQVNLNNVLHDLGYLVFRTTDDAGKPVKLDVETIRQSPARMRDGLGFVDWKRTRAYSLGIGEVYVNLKEREPLGIVPPSEYDALTAQLRKDLLALTDPEDGAHVVTSVERRDHLYSGPWWKEGMTQRKVAGKLVDAWNDGFADLFVGYSPNYRASWSSTAGNLDSSGITVNDTHWSGDHVSVDPAHVPGVLFSNRRFTQPAQPSLQDFGPTVLVRYGLDPAPPHTQMDGHPLPFEGLTR
jgi:predicted AlkP superfamily phosphohydrolase/phosphomutase